MKADKSYGRLASRKNVEKTAAALRKNGITVFVLESAEDARKKAAELIPENSEVMNMSSVTLQETGLDRYINEQGRFNSVKNRLGAMDRKTQGGEMRRLGAAPEWAVGSVHAVTTDGQVLVASMTGSQLPAYAYGANRVLWVAGTQKIVKNLDRGMKRIYRYVYPLEDERALKAYGVHSSVNKILVVNRESAENRITMMLVGEKLGF